jgi:CDP-diacylglycerol---glycerol-3-phosphate 3-phosphatidyltransferase
MTLANKLTFVRLGLVPVFMVALAFPHLWTRIVALVIFIGASLTDLYDGRLARRTGTVTRIGTFLDPLADKLLIAAALISFIEIHELSIPAWLVVLIIAREFLITGLRSLAAARGVVMAADTAGKWKTGAQMTAIITILSILIVNVVFERWPSLFWPLPHSYLHYVVIFLTRAPSVLVFLTMLVTLSSGVLYIVKYRRLLREELAMQKTPTPP